MRIGILTFHFGNNYGGVLQCYALTKALNKLGYDVEIINCIAQSPFQIISNYTHGKMADLFKKFLIQCRYFRLSKKQFDSFRKDHLNLTRRLKQNELDSFCQKYDAVIVGSDQIWNYSQQKLGVYFCEWANEFKGKRISYAACSGSKTILLDKEKELNQLLSKFNSISVRDATTQQFVKQISNKEPVIVSDPTLLHDFNEFENIAIIGEPYIFVYILGKEIEGGFTSAISKIKNKFQDCKVVTSIIASSNPILLNGVDKIIYDASPIEWINLIRNSKYVFTDSFHCILFSIKYGIPYTAYYADKLRAPRLLDLQKMYKLNNSIVGNVSSIEATEVPSNLTKEIIELQKEKSIEFIIESLNK